MPKKLTQDRIGRVLDELRGQLGRIEVKDAEPKPAGGATPVARATTAMPTSGAEDELLAVTAMPTEQGKDELLTISVLAY